MKIRFAVAPDRSSLRGPEIMAFAEALEGSGFDGIWLSDIPASPLLDPLLGLALIAGRTSRLRLGANVVPLGRNPFMLAKELAQLDRLSRGRLLLSFVTGLSQPGEGELLGVDGRARGEMLERTLARVRGLWQDAEPGMRPIQSPLEVWLGGRGPRALERVGRIADGWLGAALTPAEAGPARERIRRAAEREGREVDPEHFGMSIPYARSDPGAQALAEVRRRRGDIDAAQLLPVGAKALRALLEAYVGQGLSKFVLRPAGAVASWPREAGWLEQAVLDLQT